MRKARVLYGINNLFYLLCDGVEIPDARIKGKELKNVSDEYNALSAGDFVFIDDNNQITERLERDNFLSRFNWKLNRLQTICANVDLALCVVAAKNPPLHPRFLDRLLITSELGNVKPIIVINKCDEGIDDVLDIIEVYRKLNYEIILLSALTGDGVDELKTITKNKICAFIGSSGVGKSTLLNKLAGKEYQKTALINKKFNRGNHQTNFSIFIKREEGGYWVDSPGVRDLTPNVDKLEDLADFYPEFTIASKKCAYQNCSHINEEVCGVKEDLEKNLIDESRYLGYMKLYDEILLKNSKRCRYKKK